MGRSEIRTINLGRILECKVLEETFLAQVSLPVRKKETLVLEVTDERNALERVMMKFAHYKKEAWRLEKDRYQVEMEYDMEEETDVLIQILNFGSYVKVLAPDRLQEELKKRLQKQLQMSSQLFSVNDLVDCDMITPSDTESHTVTKNSGAGQREGVRYDRDQRKSKYSNLLRDSGGGRCH